MEYFAILVTIGHHPSISRCCRALNTKEVTGGVILQFFYKIEIANLSTIVFITFD